MTQAQGMKAKGPNYHGNKVTSCSAVWPISQEPRKMFQQMFLYFLCGYGVRRQGVCCPTSKFEIIELKPDALLKVS